MTTALPHGQTSPEQWLAEIIRSIRFGSVEITIHEGRVVQIEKRE